MREALNLELLRKYKKMESDFKEKEPKQNSEKSKRKITTTVVSIFSGNFLKGDNIIGALPYIFFLTFLGLCYIANGFYAEKEVRDIVKTNKEVKDMRSEYITIKSELNYNSKQSQVASAVAPLGLKESGYPPIKIVVKEKTYKSISE